MIAHHFTKLKKRRDNGNHNSGKYYTNNNDNSFTPRLILTYTDIQKGEPVISDTNVMDIDIDYVIACTGYPFYGIPSTKKDGRYLWDGSSTKSST
jgi:NTE family protein